MFCLHSRYRAMQAEADKITRVAALFISPSLLTCLIRRFISQDRGAANEAVVGLHSEYRRHRPRYRRYSIE